MAPSRLPVALLLLFASVIVATIAARPFRAEAQPPIDGNCPDGAHGARLHQRPQWNMEAYSQQSRASVTQALQAQIQNGEAVEMTVWNHHFADEVGEDGTMQITAQLQPSGLALLHRAARRYSQRPDFLILVQTARDLPFTQDKLASYASEVDRIDAERAAAVKAYLAQVLRRPDARVLVHDPAVVGMPSEEMTLAYLNMIHYGPKGVLLIRNNDITTPAEGVRDTEANSVASRSGTGAAEVASGTSGTPSAAKGSTKGKGKK